MVEFIRGTIRAQGPVTFAWFMEQALYHPEHGYYSSGYARIGRGGDYFTNVSVGPLFGRLITAQFAEMWDALGQPDEFAIVEQGAHDGQFAQDVIEAARSHHPEFFRALRYRIIEPFSIPRARQEATLKEFQVEWNDSLESMAPFRGVHFSNELMDAMPVHLVKWHDGEWQERHVMERGGEFVFVDLPLSDPSLIEQLRKTSLPPNECYETEINLAALRWIETLAEKINEGFVVVVDYGHPRDEFYAPNRSAGTLRCYAEHRVISSPLSHLGQVDITAHVEWTSLMEQAVISGLTSCGFTDQHHFLTGLLSGALAAEFEASTDPKTKRALQTLLHPEMLGRKFQFLVLGKNIEARTRLTGLRFARQ